MSNQIIASELCAELSEGQQEVVTGGADFKLSGSNYANRLANLQGLTTSGPNGSGARSIGQTSDVNTASQDLLGLGVAQLPIGIRALGAAPVLTG
ncbi:MAG: CTB family bacteriocin [Gloeotrichia echinulata GP01]